MLFDLCAHHRQANGMARRGARAGQAHVQKRRLPRKHRLRRQELQPQPAQSAVPHPYARRRAPGQQKGKEVAQIELVVDGEEIFAYIPSWMGPKLGALTDPAYNRSGNHQSYVDATPTAGEVNASSDPDNPSWKTVLVSGTGGGGRGVFALDITNPDAFGP